MDSLSANGGGKQGWQSPEKIAGGLVLAGLAAVGVYYWGLILPFLISTLENTLHFAVLCGILGVIVFAISSRRLRVAVSYAAQMLLRKAVSIVWTIDSIGVMEITIQDAEKKREELDTHIGELAQQEGKLNEKIKLNSDKMAEKLSFANNAKRMGKEDQAQLALIEAGGLQETNAKLVPLHNNTNNILAFLNKVYKSSDFSIKKMKIIVSQKKDEYEIVKASYSSLKTAMSLFKGDPDKNYMFEQSMNFIQEDMGKKLGEMKRAMEMSTEFLDTIDIEKGVCSDKGLKMLDEFNHTGMSLLQDNSSSNPTVDITSLQNRPEPVLVKSGAKKADSAHDSLLD
jgi:hypothetical protein